jgi:hypothetical protein
MRRSRKPLSVVRRIEGSNPPPPFSRETGCSRGFRAALPGRRGVSSVSARTTAGGRRFAVLATRAAVTLTAAFTRSCPRARSARSTARACGVSKFGARSRKMWICRWDPIFGTPHAHCGRVRAADRRPPPVWRRRSRRRRDDELSPLRRLATDACREAEQQRARARLTRAETVRWSKTSTRMRRALHRRDH